MLLGTTGNWSNNIFTVRRNTILFPSFLAKSVLVSIARMAAAFQADLNYVLIPLENIPIQDKT